MIDWADGFSHYGTDEANMLDGPYAEVSFWTLDATHVRTGTYAISSSNAGAMLRRVFSSSEATHGVAMALWVSALPNNFYSYVPFSFRDAVNAIQFDVTIWPTGQVAAYLGQVNNVSPVLLAVSPLDGSVPRITANGFNHLECWATIDDTAGAIEVRLNGVTILNYAGPLNHTGTGETSIWAWYGADGAWPGTIWVSDLIGLNDQGSTNNSFIGDKKVFEDFPTADTADADWSPSAGSATYPMVDDPDPDGDGSYIESTSPGDVSGVRFSNVDPSVVSISAILMLHKSRKTDAGTSSVQLTVDSGSDSADGVNRSMTTVYSVYGDSFEVDPATAAPWIPAGANAMSLRITRTA
jgi:hypothetical protein